MVDDIIIGDYRRTTAMRFERIERFESNKNNIDMDYDADDSIFIGYNYK